MSEPKNQHIIPRCYLKQFVDPNTPAKYEPYVWIFERKSKIGKKKAPKNILAETDFYTFKIKSGGKDYSIEKSLSQLESIYVSVFEHKIKKKIPLDNYEHMVLCSFVAVMFQRTLKQKEHIESALYKLISMAENMEKVHGVQPKKSIQLKEEMKNIHKISLAQMTPKITKFLMKMNLAFFFANGKESFITSDSPCYLFNARLQWQRFLSPAFGQKHVEVRMPLSPKIAVCFSWVNNIRGYLGISTDLVHDSNRMIFGHSHKYFIANSQKVKRGWFRRFPLDPIFLLKIFKNRIWPAIKLSLKRYKHHV